MYDTHNDLLHGSILVGGSKKGCVTINVVKDSRFGDPQTAKLPHVQHHSKCSVSDDLPRSSGTIELVQTGLECTKQVFPWVRYVEFTDTSKITCSDRRELSLSHFYIAMHGKTWYEARFGATLANAALRRIYSTSLANLASQKSMKDEEFAMFLEAKGAADDNITRAYAAARTDADFFTSLKLRMEREAMCSSLCLWIVDFVNKVVNIEPRSHTWRIDLTKLPFTNRMSATLLDSPPKYVQNGGRFVHAAPKLANNMTFPIECMD
jgi:hypothetical protein